MQKKSFDHIDGIVEICNDFYAKSPAALDMLFSELRSIGYQIENLREAEYRKRDGVSIEKMEKNGWSLWFAKLDVRRGKCGSCGGYIDTCGIQAHGHKCELCSAVTYYNIIDGSDVRFSFIPKDGEEYGYADVKMKAQRWDVDDGWLYLYPKINGGLWTKDEAAEKYFYKNKDKWECVDNDGNELIRVRYTQPFDSNISAINPSDIYGHFWNHKIVKVWDGKEYDEYFSDFPMNDSISIYEAWHWMPYESSPILQEKIISAAGMVSDCGYYYQDGRAAFFEVHLERMRKFVKHFTKIDIDAWDRMIHRADKSGPGMIRAIAKFCHHDAQVENRPNIGNVINGFSKVMSGGKLTGGEMDALVDGLKSREISKDFVSLLK